MCKETDDVEEVQPGKVYSRGELAQISLLRKDKSYIPSN